MLERLLPPTPRADDSLRYLDQFLGNGWWYRVAVLFQTGPLAGDRGFEIPPRLVACITLAPATRQCRALSRELPVFILFNYDAILHGNLQSNQVDSTLETWMCPVDLGGAMQVE